MRMLFGIRNSSTVINATVSRIINFNKKAERKKERQRDSQREREKHPRWLLAGCWVRSCFPTITGAVLTVKPPSTSQCNNS